MFSTASALVNGPFRVLIRSTTTPTVFANEYVTNPPHTVLSYSNTGFALLGNIIERVSKRNFSDYLEDSIFARLGMDHSAIGFDNERVRHSFSKCYDLGRETDPLYLRDVPSGSVVMTIADFSLFVKMLFSHGTLGQAHIIDDSTLAQMWTPQNSDLPYDVSTVGLGYGLSNPVKPLQIVGHDGYVPHFRSLFIALPKVKLGFIVFTNTLQGDPEGLISTLMEAFYMSKTGGKMPEMPSLPRMPEVQLSPQRLNEIPGYYQTTAGIHRAEVKGKHCVMHLDGKPFTLIPLSDSTFTLQYYLLGLIPVRVPDLTIEIHADSDRTMVVVRSKGAMAVVGEKFIPQTPPQAWLDRVGTYEPVNDRKGIYTDTQNVLYKNFQKFNLAYDSKEKNFSLNGDQIRAISDTEAVTRGWGRSAGETIRAYRENGKEYLWAWGYALRRISSPAK
jgi:hypothetical protein